MSLWFEGIFVGFSIAVPVSEIGFLCIQETLQGGIRLGIAAGIGAALADMMFGIIVALGLGAAQTWLLQYKIPMSIMGGFFLCYLGIKKFFSRPPKKIRHPAYSDLLKVFASTFFITLTDPETILDFIALFTGLIIDTSTNVDSIKFVAGVFIGSAAWWLLLSTSMGFFRPKVSHQLLHIINYVAGAVIFGFGLWSLYEVW